MAAKILGLLPTIGTILGKLNDGAMGADWQNLQKSLSQFGDLMVRLVRESGRSRIVQQKALTALFEIRNKLQDILDESATARYSRERCMEIFENIKNATEFEQLDIGEFLSKEKLLQYGVLFDAEGIMYASDLAEITDGELESTFKPNMKSVPFSRLHKIIIKTRKSQHYVENDMEKELHNIQDLLEKSDKVIQKKLSSFMDTLAPVIIELAETIKDEEMRTILIVSAASLALAVGALAFGGFGVGCLLCGVPGMVALLSCGTLTCTASAAFSTGVGVGAHAGTLGVATIGGFAIYKAHKDMKKEVQQLKNTYEMVTEWQEALREQFLHWRDLMKTFRQLFVELRRSRRARDQYSDTGGDIENYFKRTKQLLEETLQQTDAFEVLVKDLKNRKIR
ncbi:uncharacterized protein LOC144443720 [Glandiceps talaboti]